MFIPSDIPCGVHIESNFDELPIRPDRHRRWIPLRRGQSNPELLMFGQTTNGKHTILTIPDALGINGDTQISPSRVGRINPRQNDSCPCRLPPTVNPADCTLCRAANEVDSN